MESDTTNLPEAVTDTITNHNDNKGDANGTIIFPNGRLAILWVNELLGQISDGAWEGHWYDHPDTWKDYYNLNIHVQSDDTVPVLTDAHIDQPITDWNPTTAGDEDLVDIIGSRMVEMVQDAGYPDYDETALREDLNLLNKLSAE